MNFKTYEQYKNLAIAKATANLPNLDSKTDPILLTIAEAAGASAFSLQSIFVDLIEDVLFPQTASGAFLRNVWGDYEGVYPLTATPSIGYINAETDTQVTLNAEYTIDGLIFIAQETSIDVSGTYYATFDNTDSTTVTVTTMDSTYTNSVPHYLGTGNTITIDSGDYEGEHTIEVIDESSFTFTVESSVPSFNGTYNISANQYFLVQCESTGVETNFENGELQAVDNSSDISAYITYQGLTGGSDNETDDAYRDRILKSRSLVEGDFTNGQIILAALTINGNTRVFVVNPDITEGDGMPDTTGSYTASCTDAGTDLVNFETDSPHYLIDGQEITIDDGAYTGAHTITKVDSTNFTIPVAHSDNSATYTVSYEQFAAVNKDKIPKPGIVYVFILRDNDSTITPSKAIIDVTKTEILSEGKLPSHTPASNVVVFAPTLSFLSFEITDMLPNTATMKNAVKTQLQAFFEDNTKLSTSIPVDAIRAAIWETEDLTNNERITSFNLTKYGQNDSTVITPAISISGVSSIDVSQGSIAAFDETDTNSVVFATT